MVEAMACGKPVIAFERGSVPEIIRHAENGFIVDSVNSAVEALKEVPRLDPAEIRRSVEEMFSSDRMIDSYIKVYEEVLQMGDNEANNPKFDRRPFPHYRL